MATEDDQRTQGTVFSKSKCGEQDTNTAGGKWRRQHRTRPKDGEDSSVACVPPGATKLNKVNKVIYYQLSQNHIKTSQ